MGASIRLALVLWLFGTGLAGDAWARPAATAKRPLPASVEPAPVAEPVAPPPPSHPSVPVVGSVELHLPKDADPKGLAELVVLRPGAPLKKKDVRRTLERLYGTGRFSDIVIYGTPDASGRLAVVIEADTRTFVDRVEFEGNAALKSEELTRALALTERRPEYYLEGVERLSARLANAYRRIGYTRVRVSHALVEGEAGEVVLSFQILEGDPTRLKAIHVAGDPELPMDEIVQTLGLAPGDVLDQDRLERGYQKLKARYRAEGFYRARFGAPQVIDEPDGAVLQLPVTAGTAVQFRFEGNEAFDDREAASAGWRTIRSSRSTRRWRRSSRNGSRRSIGCTASPRCGCARARAARRTARGAGSSSTSTKGGRCGSCESPSKAMRTSRRRT